MSAKGHNPPVGGDEENYPTPAWCVHRLFDRLQMRPLGGSRWLEPCAGEGNLIRAVSSRPEFGGVSWVAGDIRPVARAAPELVSFVGDFLTVDIPDAAACDLVITNPPYSKAQAFIQRALQIAPQATVMMLLRLNFLAGDERSEWLSRHVPEIYVLPNRPSFRAVGTDSCEYGWMVWRPPWLHRRVGSVQVLDTTPLDVRKRDKADALALLKVAA